MDHESLLVVLPDSQAEAKSMKEIAQAMGLEITTHTDWIRAERSLARSLRALIRWGWVARDQRQKEDGHKFWYNAYWKTEVAKQVEDTEL
jgi:predicted transcriptional regulator